MKDSIKRVGGVFLVIMLLFSAIIPCGIFNSYAADQVQHGAEGIMAYHHSNQGDPKYVDYDYSGTKPDYQEAPDLGISYPWYVYCINQNRNAMDYERWNQHFRWRWNLGANKWLLDNSKQQNLDDGMSNPAGSEAYDFLMRILYYGYPNNYDGGNFSYDDTQAAVEALMDGNDAKQNELYNKAKNSTITVNGNLYMFIADSDSTQIVQNKVGLAVWGPPSGEDDTPSAPEGKLSTTVSAGGETASADKAAQLSAEKAESLDTVTDQIDYEGLKGGATYKVQGTLVELGDADDGSADVEIAKSESKECVADDSGSGTWEIEFTGLKGKLKAGKKYVVYEKATNKDDENDVIEHASRDDTAQTIVVDEKKPEDENPNNPPNDEPPVVEETPDNPDEGLSDNPNDEAPVLDDNPADSNSDSVVNTGDSTEILNWAIMLVVACVALAYVCRKDRYVPKH